MDDTTVGLYNTKLKIAGIFAIPSAIMLGAWEMQILLERELRHRGIRLEAALCMSISVVLMMLFYLLESLIASLILYNKVGLVHEVGAITCFILAFIIRYVNKKSLEREQKEQHSVDV